VWRARGENVAVREHPHSQAMGFFAQHVQIFVRRAARVVTNTWSSRRLSVAVAW
jgi:hypothetical protein